MRAVVTQPTRIIGDNSYSVHPGDILEGADAALQVAAGNADVLPDQEPAAAEEAAVELSEPALEQSPPEADPKSAVDGAPAIVQEVEAEVVKLTDALKQNLAESGNKGA